MSEIGILTPLNDGETDEYTGHIRTLNLDLFIRLTANPRAAKPNAPSHTVLAKATSGAWAQIGSAWLRTMTRGERPGEAFFTITVDDPSLPHALNVAAFRKPGSNGFAVAWRRRQANAAAAQGA